MMSKVPATRYAKSGDIHIAYQVLGDGPLDLVVVPENWSHLEAQWEEPRIARFLGRLASFSRLILFDKEGTGLSDPVPRSELRTFEQWMDDVRAVMDAVGSERAALFGQAGGGPMSMLFAATYPERTSALVLHHAYARLRRDVDYPAGMPPQVQEYLLGLVDYWGTGSILDTVGPSIAGDAHFRDWFARYERLSASPGVWLTMMRMVFQVDVRGVLSSIRVPTLLLQRAGARYVRVGHGRYLAEHIPGSKYVELPGEDHFPWLGDADAVVDEIEEFLTGVRRRAAPDRVLATLMFTDIVDSTRRAAEMGDRRWRAILEHHHLIARRQLKVFRGREVKSTGDGILATFDGPARAIRCACAIRDEVPELGIEIRAGLHTGECELIGDDVGGIAVHLASRVAAMAGPGEVLVSRTVTDLVAGSGIAFEERGEHELKGAPGHWQLFAVQQ